MASVNALSVTRLTDGWPKGTAWPQAGQEVVVPSTMALAYHRAGWRAADTAAGLLPELAGLLPSHIGPVVLGHHYLPGIWQQNGYGSGH